MKRFLAVLIALLLTSSVCLARVSGYDFILVLDSSGSMSGTPISVLKQAAVKVVDDLVFEGGDINIAFVEFDSQAYLQQNFLPLRQSADSLKSKISSLYANGGTATDLALDLARTTTSGYMWNSSGRKIIAIVMSDGYPTSPIDSVYNAADKLKYLNSNVSVYSVGFFHSLSSNELKQCEDVMRYIASDNTKFFTVNDANEFGLVFADIFDIILDADKIIIWVDCPVDVSISFNGETLDKNNRRTSFGTLQFEGENNERKVLRLNQQNVYQVSLTGTGDGYMDYTVRYPDANGDYTDTRKIVGVPVSNGMTAVASTAQYNATEIRDNSGNVYTAAAGQKVIINDHTASIDTYRGTWAVTASSYNADINPTAEPSQMMDGNTSTSWDAWGEYEGAWVRLSVTNGYEYRINGIRINNGKGMNADYYDRNSRVKDCSIYVDNVYVGTCTLDDKSGTQVVTFPQSITGSSVYIVVDSVYSGSRYGDPNYGVCISELSLW